MQFYALNKNKELISAHQARKREDYYCRECRGILRIRGGIHRQTHFFHLKPTLACRHSRKSLTHLQIQRRIQACLPEGECLLERRFSEIDRIADVSWETKKLIFEVQCSGISAEEVRSRNDDYKRMGYQVVWILHDRRFNKWKISAAERFLQNSPYYFTNMDHNGAGEIYDQLDIWNYGRRKTVCRMPGVKLEDPQKLGEVSTARLPKIFAFRIKGWPFYFSGDLIDKWKHEDREVADHLSRLFKREKQLFFPSGLTLVGQFFRQYVVRPYFLFFHLLLESLCAKK